MSDLVKSDDKTLSVKMKRGQEFSDDGSAIRFPICNIGPSFSILFLHDGFGKLQDLLHKKDAQMPDIVFCANENLGERERIALDNAGYFAVYNKGLAMGCTPAIICFQRGSFDLQNYNEYNLEDKVSEEMEAKGLRRFPSKGNQMAIVAILRHCATQRVIKVGAVQSCAARRELQIAQEFCFLRLISKNNIPFICAGISAVAFDASLASINEPYPGAFSCDIEDLCRVFQDFVKMHPNILYTDKLLSKIDCFNLAQTEQGRSGLKAHFNMKERMYLIEELSQDHESILEDFPCLIVFTNGDREKVETAKVVLQDVAIEYATKRFHFKEAGQTIRDLHFFYEGAESESTARWIRALTYLELYPHAAIVDTPEKRTYQLHEKLVTEDNLNKLVNKFLNLNDDYLPVWFY